MIATEGDPIVTEATDRDDTCDCNISKSPLNFLKGCYISKLPPPGFACWCFGSSKVEGVATTSCLGHVTKCLEPTDPSCVKPDDSFAAYKNAMRPYGFKYQGESPPRNCCGYKEAKSKDC